MAELYDVTLGGVGYMIAPRSYRRGMDSPGLLGSEPVRQVQREFVGGLRPAQVEGDRFASSLGLLPLLPVGSGGVGAGPKETSTTVAGLVATLRRHAAIHGGRPYYAAGGNLYRPDRAGLGLNPNNLGATTTLGATLAGDANGLASDGGTRLYLSRDGQPFAIWTIGGGAFDTTPTIQLNGCAWYAGSLWGGYFDGILWRLVRCTSGTAYEAPGWPIDSVPRAFAALRDGLYFGTQGGLWRARGSVVGAAFSGTVEQLAGQSGGTADDFLALADFNGQVHTWHNGEVCRYSAGGIAPAQFVGTGLRGHACRGLAVAGGYLFAAVTDGIAANGTGLWAYDGRGWWCLGRNTDGSHDYAWPLPTAGYFDNGDLLVFGGGTKVHALQLRPRPTQPGLAASGELVTSLWHGRDADAAKLWTKAGAEFGWLPYQAFGAATVELDYSLDGNTFTEFASGSISSSAPATLAAILPAATVGKAFALRYRLSGVTGGSPILRALWSEYRPIEEVVPRRHWQFDVQVSDEQVRRNGSKEPRSGKQIAADLWAQWEVKGTYTLRDVDYDLVAVQRSVMIVGVDETVERADQRGRWGESVCRVRLVEV